MRKCLIFLIVFLASFGLITFVLAGVNDNLSGFAWSSNIGWISFNSVNCDIDGNGFSDGTVPGCPSEETEIGDYGVNIDSEGSFSGYAWSSNIGWLRFDPEGPYPEQPNYSACLDLPGVEKEDCKGVGDNQVSGWARACSVFESGCEGNLLGSEKTGGWDGWLKLKGTAQDGSSYGVSLKANEFEGWAWGGNEGATWDEAEGMAVIGWVSFNCSDQDTCADSDYKVEWKTGNNPPTALIGCSTADCTEYEEEAFVLINNSTDPEGTEDIVKSEWYLKKQGQPDAQYELKLSCSELCNYTPQLEITSNPDNYTVKLYVEDTGADSDTAVRDFRIKQDAEAGFMCSLDLDKDKWEVCEDIEVKEGENVFLRDNSSLSEYSSFSEGASQIVSRVWEADGDIFDSDNNSDTSVTAGASTEVKLTITDDAGRTAVKNHTITGELSLPEWREIPPAGLLIKIFSVVFNFLKI